MFELKFAPTFARQRAALLAQATVPPVAIPPVVEARLSAIAHGDGTRTPATGAWPLWRDALRPLRALLARSAALALLAAACTSVSTLAAMQILEPGHTLGYLWGLALVFFAMNCLAQVGTFWGGRVRIWISMGIEAHLVGLISRKLLRLSTTAAARQSSGNLKTLITADVRNVGQFVDNAVRNLIPAVVSLAVIGPLVVRFSGRPGALGLLVMASGIPIALALNVINARLEMRSKEALDRLTTLVGEWVKNIRLIRYLSWDDAFQRDVAVGTRGFLTVSVVQHALACLIYGLSISWWMVSATGVVVLSRVLGDPLDLRAFLGSLWLLTFMAGFFTGIPNTIRLYGNAAPSVRRIARLLAEEEQADLLRPGEPLAADATPTHLVFEAVSYQYPGGKAAVQDCSLEIALDRQLAIIGEVGAGKTTLLRLLCGEIPPSSGRILVRFSTGDERDLWTEPAHDRYRQQLAYVPQEPFVSSDLLHMNITLSGHALHEREDDIAAAAYWAELEADLQALPDGLSQEIGEGGVNLSGGQRQRVNLARAFYSQRPCMVLDDTMSAVDVVTEAALMDRLLSRGRGFVLVTHRTGELLRLQDVVVMKNGRIVERGAPVDLASDPDSHLTRVLRAYEQEGAA
ncbi:MAG: ABC transporter ATP-binding protein [Vicinamibacterales bacterium]